MITPVPDGWTQLPGRILPIEGFFGASRSDLPHEIDELARFESLVAAQGRVLDRLTADEDLSHVLLVIARMVEAHTAALCAILIVDTAGATLRAGAIPTLPETFVTAMDGLKIGSVAGSCGTAAFRRAPVVSPDISNDPLWSDHRELMMSLGVLAAWSLPVIAPGGDVVATLAMYASEQRLPDEWEMRVAGLAVSLTALAIQRSGAARTTLDTDAGYRLLWETSPDAVMLLDEESRIQAASPAMLQVFGYAPDEVIGRDLAMLQPERLREAHRAGMRRYLATGEKKLDWRATRIAGLHKDGHEFAVELAFSDLQIDGTRQFAGFARDVSERARAEEALKQAEARYRALAENAFDLVCELDSQGRFAYVSPNFKDVLGYEPETLLGQSPFALIHDDDRERVFQQFAEAISEQAPPGTSTFRLQRQDETWCWLEVSANFYRDEAGESHAVILARDIAQRMAMEATLRVSEERLRTFVEHAPLILTATDREGRYVLQEGAGLARFGIGPGEHIGQSIFELYADQPRVCENLRRALAGESFADVVELFGVTFEVHHEPVRDEAGDVAGMIAILIDVTARVRAEAAVRESEERLRTFVENAPLILFGTDREGVFTLFDGKGVEPLGVARGQYVGESIFEAMAAFPDIVDGARRALAGETVMYLFRSELAALEVHQSPVRDAGGEITGTIGLVINVSDRMQAEEALRESEDRLRTVVGNVPVILFATDREGVYTLSEGAGLRSVGLEPGQYVGQSIFDVYPGLPQVTDGARRALAGEAVTYLLRLGGVAMDVHLSPVRDKTGEITGSIGVAIDVSDRQRAEDGMNRRAEELEQMYRRLAETHAELEESKQHLEEKSSLLEHALELERERSRHDQLTGALNHAAITDAVREMIRADAGRSLAIAMVDVDGLKAANDTYGHQVGDAVLVLVAQKLMLGGAIVGRYGGDEFVAIVPGADRVAAEQYRDDVLASLVGAGLTDERTGAHIPVVASMGLAIYPEEAGAVDDLIRLSDSAMYASRRRRVADGGESSSRSLGGDRAAKMVGEIVPLLTSPGALADKLRLVSHRLSVGAGYDAVDFTIFAATPGAPIATNVFARVPAAAMEAWRHAREEDAIPEPHPLRTYFERSPRPVIIEDLTNSELLTPSQRTVLAAAGLCAGLVAPMIWQDQIEGILSVASKRSGAFTASDAQFLAAVATQVTAIVRMSSLVEQLQTSSSQLKQAHEGTVLMLASAAEAHDHTTGRHLQRVRAISEAIARELGYDDERAAALGMAAILHDIGKIRVPDSVLGSSNSLADAEWVLMKQHTLWGAAFLSEQPGFELAASVARHHHERWDGAGYPDGLSGEEIPESALITTVADSFDAMTNNRPYRRGRPVDEAVREIQSCAGTQFSPRVVDALTRLFDRGDLAFVHPDEDEQAAA